MCFYQHVTEVIWARAKAAGVFRTAGARVQEGAGVQAVCHPCYAWEFLQKVSSHAHGLVGQIPWGLPEDATEGAVQHTQHWGTGHVYSIIKKACWLYRTVLTCQQASRTKFFLKSSISNKKCFMQLDEPKTDCAEFSDLHWSSWNAVSGSWWKFCKLACRGSYFIASTKRRKFGTSWNISCVTPDIMTCEFKT